MERTARMRASDQDRNEAVLALGEHHAAGRLTLSEFTTRMEQALTCTYLHELDPLFADLPVVRSTAVVPAPPAPARRAAPPPAAMLMMLLLAMSAVLVVGAGFFFPFWLPLALFWLIGGSGRHRHAGAASLTPRTGRSCGAVRPGGRGPTSSSGQRAA
jgi:hypothetical protein